MEIVDKSKIMVEVKLHGTAKFVNTPVSSTKVNTVNKTLLELTLSTAAIDYNIYRVKVGAGALRATASNLTNTTELNSSEFTYSTSPILNTARPPHILNNKIIATFNLPIVLKDWTKVKVYKNPAAGNEAIPLTGDNIAVNNVNRSLMEITLPAVKAGEVYRLKLEAKAVHEEKRIDNENEAIEPTDLDITIGAAPVLDADNDPYLSGQKIIVPFNSPIIILDSNKIKYQMDGTTTITPNTEPKVVNNKQLEIPLNALPAAGQLYRIELDTGAISGKNTVSIGAIQPEDKDIIVWDITAVKPAFIRNREFSVTFPPNMEIVDASKIEVEFRAAGESGFRAATANGTVNNTNRKLLELALSTAAIDYNIYKVKVRAGALRATANQSVNTTELTSGETTYFTGPILDTANHPYILNNKLVATFDLSIALKDWTKVKVYKDPSGENDGNLVALKKGDIAVKSKNLLEITLPPVKADEVYRLRLEVGAVQEEDREASKNKVIEPKDRDITIDAAPVLDADNNPYLSGQNIIVPFNSPISILDGTKIKYLFKSNAGAGFGVAIKTTNPAVSNNNLLEIPLNEPPEDGQVYRIDLATGALSGGKNKSSMDTIRPGNKDITVWLPDLANVKPVFENKKKFSVTFPVDVAIIGDGSTINVQKKDDGDGFTTLGATSRTIAVDGTNPAKINIILPEENRLYQVWNVEFPANTVKTAKNNISNFSPLTTDDSEKSKLTDLYSWNALRGGWSPRSGHTSVVFQNKIWVLGGVDNLRRYNDVWSSPDGSTWTESTPPGSASKNVGGANKNWWGIRHSHTSVVFKGKIWLLGGRPGGTTRVNDVWSSADGSTWTESTPKDKDGNTVAKKTAGKDKNWWAVRSEHTSVVFDPDGNGERIWVIGGRSALFYNDVWSSADGETWIEESAQAGASVGWAIRASHSSAVFDNKIWIIGGWANRRNSNSVWYSTNGRAWTRDTYLPHGVSNTSAVKYKDRLWSLGGDSRKESFWSSASPATEWTAENTLSAYNTHTQAVVFKNRIWLLGGYYEGNRTNRVWNMGPASP